MQGVGYHAQCLGRRPMLNSGLMRPSARAVAHPRPAKRAGAVHVAAFATSGAVVVKITVPEHSIGSNQQLVLVGSCHELGNWQPANGKRMKCEDGNAWSAELSFPTDANFTIEYKIVAMGDHNSCVWEPGMNRKLHVAGAPDMDTTVEAVCAWGKGGELVKTSRLPVHKSMEASTASPSSLPSINSMAHCQVVVPAAELGKKYMLVGSVPQLGSWDLKKGLHLTTGADQVCRAEVELPVSTSIEAKLVLVDGGIAKWEGGDNRTLSLAPPPSFESIYTVAMTFGVPANDHIVRTHTPKGATLPLVDTLAASCHFTVPSYTPRPGQHLVLVGTAPELGSWDVKNGLQLKCLPGHAWAAKATLPATCEVEAKLVVVEGDGRVFWESGPNRKLRPAGTMTTIGAAATGVESLISLPWNAPAATTTMTIPIYPTPDTMAAAPVAEPQAVPTPVVVEEAAPAPIPVAEVVLEAAAAEAVAPAVASEEKKEEVKEKHDKVLSTFLKFLVSSFSGSASQEEILKAGKEQAEQAAAAAGTPAAQLQQMVQQVAALRNEVAPSQPAIQEVAQVDAALVVPGAKLPTPEPVEQAALVVMAVTPEPEHAKEPAPVQTTSQVAAGTKKARSSRSTSRSRKEMSPRRTISPAPRGQALPDELAPYEAHVMAILAMYPNLPLDRLQTMMCASTVPPKYDKAPEKLTVLLKYLERAGTLVCESGEYRLKDIEVPRPRKRSPSPRPPSLSTAAKGTRARSKAPAGEVEMSAYEMQVMATLGLHGSLSLDRLHQLMTLSTVNPHFDKSLSQLGGYLGALVNEGKVAFAGGMYMRGAIADTPVELASDASDSEASKVRRSRASSKSPRASSKSPRAKVASPEPVTAKSRLASSKSPRAKVASPEPVSAKGKRASSKSPRPKVASPEPATASSPRRRATSKSPKPADVPSTVTAEAIVPVVAEIANMPVTSSLPGMDKYENHVLAVVKSYSTISAERLQTMMRASSSSTGYDASEAQLGEFLMQLTAAGKIIEEGGIYKNKGAEASADADDLVRSTKRRTSRSTPQPSRAGSESTF